MQVLRVEVGSLSLVWKKIVSIADRSQAGRDLRRHGKLLRLRFDLDAGRLGIGRVHLRRAGYFGLLGSNLRDT